MLLFGIRYRKKRQFRKEVVQELVSSSDENTDIIVHPSDLQRHKFSNDLVVKDHPDHYINDYYTQQITPWPVLKNPKLPSDGTRNRQNKYFHAISVHRSSITLLR